MDKYCFYCLVINAISYTLFLIIYQCKKRAFDLGTLMLAAWNVGSWGAVYYYTFPVSYLSYNKISILPLITLFIVNGFLMKPFLIINYTKLTKIDTGNLSGVFRWMSIFFATVGILPFFNIILKLSTFSLAGAALAEMYSADEDTAQLLFSPIVKPFYSILRHFVPVIIFLFFYYLTQKKRNLFITIGLSMNVITFFIVSLLSGSRGGVLSTLIICAFFFFFMRNMFSKRLQKFIMKLGMWSIVMTIVGIGYISVSRLSDMSGSKNKELLMDEWLSQYAGEGIVRYDNTIWHLSNHMNGYQNFPFFLSFFDQRLKDLDSVANIGESKLRTPITVFYTYFGDFIIDFGIIGAIVLVVLTYYLIKYLIKPHKNSISFYHLILLNYFFTLITIGFTANIFRTYYTQTPIVDVTCLLLFLYIFQILSSKYATTRNRNTCIQANISKTNT